ncbi:MAG: hypothetical protein GC161_08645 [Planctomycetaceae bacterium]|nr:hypothetical protein [Planctomycetaceae bacterium]
MGERKTRGVSPWVWAMLAALLGIAALALLDPRGSSDGAEPFGAHLGADAVEPLLQPARNAGVGRSTPSMEGNAVDATPSEPASTSLPLSHTLIVVDESGARVTADVTVLGFDFEERFSVDARADPVAVAWERLPVRIEARTAHASGELALLAMPPEPVIAVMVRPFAQFAGVVVDPAGQAVGSGVRVALYDRRYATNVQPLGEASTGSDGRFVVRGLPADVPMVAHVGGGGFVGASGGYSVALNGKDARLVAQYLFGIAIDGSSHERGLEDCSVNQGLIWTGNGREFRQLAEGHPGFRHLSASWTYVESTPYSRVLLFAGDKAETPPVLRVGAQRSGRKHEMHEVTLQRVFDKVETFRLDAATEVAGAAPRDASIALLFSAPPGIERLTSNDLVGQIGFQYADGGSEIYGLRRDDLLRGMVITCMPRGEARVEVGFEIGVAHDPSMGQTLPAVSLSRDRATVFVDLSHLSTLEVEAFDAHAGPVRGKLTVYMARSDLPRDARGRRDWSVQRHFSEPPYLVLGLAPAEYFIDCRSPQASPDRPASVKIPHGGGLVKALLNLSSGAK